MSEYAEERADCTSMPPCANCGHGYDKHLCPVKLIPVYCDDGDDIEVCGCEEYEPMTKADLEEEYGPVHD